MQPGKLFCYFQYKWKVQVGEAPLNIDDDNQAQRMQINNCSFMSSISISGGSMGAKPPVKLMFVYFLSENVARCTT